MRIDKYLKVSRLIKRRTVAHDAAEADRILLNGKTAKPGAQVKAGDIICIRFGTSEMTVRVLATPEHVSKEEADSLYEVVTE